MATLTVTPLNNGIVLGVSELVSGMLPLNSGSYLYYTNHGNIYYQSNPTTPVTLILAAGFAITCTDLVFDGITHTIFMGGASGNTVFGTLTLDLTDPQAPTQTNDLAATINGTADYTAVCFDVIAWAFTIGDAVGELYSCDPATGIITALRTLTTTNLPVSADLVVSRIVHDYTLDKYLIVGTASTNIGNDPADFTVVFTGTRDAVTLDTTEIVGHHLKFGAIGIIDNPNAKLTDNPPKPKIAKYVVAGGEGIIYVSNDGVTWVRTLMIDQTLAISSLAFNQWVFLAGLPYGMLLSSTNGEVWTAIYDVAITTDITDVKAIAI